MENFHHSAKQKRKGQVTWSINFFEKIQKSQISMKKAMKLQKNWQLSADLSLFQENHLKIVGPSRSPKCSRIPNFSTPLFFL
jgi:hypothetical protein